MAKTQTSTQPKPKKKVTRKRRKAPLVVVTDHMAWAHADRVDEADSLNFRRVTNWYNDPSVWEDFEDDALVEAARRKAGL